jgi:predicted transcriptional regulator
VLDGERRCDVGDVLYLALEDNDRRLQSRIRKLMQSQPVDGQRLCYQTEWPHVDEGCADRIRDWAETVTVPRLVVIDTLQRIRPIKEKDGYKADYEALKSLQKLASDLGIAVVVVHHTRKQEGGEAVDAISGTLGLAACADAHMVIKRDGQGTTLFSEGRDIPGGEHAMEFNKNTCRWRLLGDASDVRRSNERKVIIDALRDNFEPMTPTEIADETGMKLNNAKQLLRKMVKDGEVLKPERGKYALPERIGNE